MVDIVQSKLQTLKSAQEASSPTLHSTKEGSEEEQGEAGGEGQLTAPQRKTQKNPEEQTQFKNLFIPKSQPAEPRPFPNPQHVIELGAVPRGAVC